jgi:hypothetical protein
MGNLFPILIVIYIVVSVIKFIAKSKEQKRGNESESSPAWEEEVTEEDSPGEKREDLADDFLRLLTGAPLPKPKKVGVVRVEPIKPPPPPPAPVRKKIKAVKKQKELLKEKTTKRYLIPGVELTAYSLTNGIIMAEILSPPVAKKVSNRR